MARRAAGSLNNRIANARMRMTQLALAVWGFTRRMGTHGEPIQVECEVAVQATSRGAKMVVVGCVVLALAAPPVGVTVRQDAWRVDQLGQEHRLEVVLEVSNPTGSPIENAWLSLPSPSVGAWADSSPLAGRDAHGATAGHTIVLGTLVPGDRSEVRVSIDLGEVVPSPGTVLTGGRLTGTSGGLRFDTPVRAVKLEGPGFPAEYLAPGPEADPTDPAVAAQAALLAGPDEALELAKSIAFAPYTGSLHGARGVLYGRVANALDRSSLLVALLRALGIPARYRFGTIDDDQAAALWSAAFPPPEARDVLGAPLSGAQLAADLEGTLARLTPEAAASLGTTRAARLAALGAASHEALEALVLEPALPDAETLAALKSHVWVEAWIGDAWTALDPSFKDAVVGEQHGVPSGEPTAGIAPELRHQVAIRVIDEEYAPAFMSAPEKKPATLDATFWSVELVGTALVVHHALESKVVGGMVFFHKTSTYTPRIDLRDLERRSETTIAGTSYTEFASNFGGGIANDHATGVFVEVESLAPGQTLGNGVIHERLLADRLGADTRAGGGVATGDFGGYVTQAVDVMTLVVQAAPTPPRLVAQEQATLNLATEAAEAERQLALTEDPDGEVSISRVDRMRNLAAGLTTVLALLHDSNLGVRAPRIAAQRNARLYATRPRIVASRAATSVSPNPLHSITLDLMDQPMAALLQPGQPRSDRALVVMSHGNLATDLEGSVLALVAGDDAVSTHAVFQRALDAGIDFIFLEGQSGLNLSQTGALAVSDAARARIQQALLNGRSVFGPSSPVVIGGKTRSAWLELSPDGTFLGRLDDGTGGALIEYAIHVYQTGCDVGAIPTAACPPGNFFAQIGGFIGGLYGLIVPAATAAFACSGGNGAICDKLVTNFSGAYAAAMQNAFSQIYQNQDPGTCDIPMFFYGQADFFGDIGCTSCTLMSEWAKGFCSYIKAYDKSQQIVIAAITDPLLPEGPAGVVDPEVVPASERGIARETRTVAPTRARADVAGTVVFEHVRLVGEVVLQTGPLPLQGLPARSLLSAQATSEQLPDGVVAWSGLDNAVGLEGIGALELTGLGTVDLVGGAGSGVVAVGDFGVTSLAPGATAAISGSPLAVRIDQLGPPSVVTGGDLSVDGVPEAQQDARFSTPTLTLGTDIGAAVGAPTAALLLEGAALVLSGAVGQLSLDGVATPAAGLGLGAYTGSAAVARSGENDQLTLAGTADVAFLTASPAAPSAGLAVTSALSSTLALSTSLGGDWDLEVTAPPGWTATLASGVATFTPPPGAPPGSQANAQARARHPSGLEVATAIPIELVPPAVAALSVAIAPDPTFAMDVLGYRLPAWLVSLHHVGAGPGTYALTATASAPGFSATLAASSVVVGPLETRRLGLRLESTLAHWPAPGTEITVEVTATGDASATASVVLVVPEVRSVGLSLEPRRLILPPGGSGEAVVGVTNLGNAAFIAPLVVTNGVTAAAPDFALTTTPPPLLAPGESGAAVLAVTAPASGVLPAELRLRIEPPPTPFEQAQGLAPAGVLLPISVTLPGTEGVIALGAAAVLEEDDAMFSLAIDLYAGASGVSDGCSAADLDFFRAKLALLVARLAGRPGSEAAHGALSAALAALDTDGCDAVPGALAALAGADLVVTLPNLAAGLSVGAPVRNGEVLAVTATVVNGGLAASSPTLARLSARSPGALGTVPVATVELPGLEGGEAFTAALALDTTPYLGPVVLDWVVDAEGVVAESDETDNTYLAVGEVLPKDGAPTSNEAPVFTSLPPKAVAPRTPFTYTLSATDPDGDPVFYAWVSGPPGVSLLGDTLSGVFPSPGSASITVVARDVFGAATEQSFTVDITALALVAEPPPLGLLPTTAVVAPATVVIPLPPLPAGTVVTVVGAPAGVVVVDEGGALRVEWPVTLADVGTHLFSVVATGADGGRASSPVRVVVRDSALGPDLRVAVSPGPDVELTVRNTGDSAAAPCTVTVFEDLALDGAADGDPQRILDVPTLLPGGVATLTTEDFETTLFPGNLLFARVDSGDVVPESDETNNLGRSVGAETAPVTSYLAVRPVTPMPLILLSPEEVVTWRVLDPIDLAPVAEGTLLPLEPTVVDPMLAGFPLDRLVLEADGRVQAYLVHEQLAPDFGAELIHPALDGRRRGRSFALFLPTLTTNNRLVIMAAEPASVELRALDGAILDSAQLPRGGAFEPAGLTAGEVILVDATGDVVIQSASVTGLEVAPPLDRDDGDVGRRFIVSTRARDPSGGAVAFFAYEAATCTARDATGANRFARVLSAGERAVQTAVGETRGLSLDCTGDVIVLAGDFATSGATALGVLGEDVLQVLGRRGTDLRLHTLRADVGDSWLLAGPAGAAVAIGAGQPFALGPYDAEALPNDSAVDVVASDPVLAQLQGGGDRHFDLGLVLRAIPGAQDGPRPVFADVSFDVATCGVDVAVTGGVGNGGDAVLSGASIELLDVSGPAPVVLATVGLEPVLPGARREFSLVAELTAGPPTTCSMRSQRPRCPRSP